MDAQLDQTPTGDTELYKVEPGQTLNYIVEDSQENEIAKGVKTQRPGRIQYQTPAAATMNLEKLRSVQTRRRERRTHTTFRSRNFVAPSLRSPRELRGASLRQFRLR